MNYIKLYYDLEGNRTAVDNDIIVGRSHLANKLQMITPMTLVGTDVMQVYFILANGQITPKRSMLVVGTEVVGEETWNVYEYQIPSDVLSVVSSYSSNTLQVLFRHAREDATATYYEQLLAAETTTLTINAAVVPDDDDIVIAIDDYDDLAAQIATKQNKDWSTYTTKTTLNDTDYITIADGDVVSHRVNVGNLITHLQADYSTLETRVTTIEGNVDQDVSIASSPNFTSPTVDDLIVRDGVGGTHTITWNDTVETMDIGINADVTLQVGQEAHIQVKATEAIGNGKGVMIDLSNPAVGSKINASLSDIDATGFFPQAFIGIATEDIANGQEGKVTHFGRVSFDTLPVRWDNTAAQEGDLVYACVLENGRLVCVTPTDTLNNLDLCLPKPIPRILVGVVLGTSGANKQIMVRPDMPKYLRYLNDVEITDEAAGDVIVRNGGNFENVNLLETGNTKIKDSFFGTELIKDVSFAGTTLTITHIDDTTSAVSLADLSEDADIIASGVVVYEDPNWYMRFTRADLTTFDVDVTSLIDDTNIITSVAGKTGDVTLVKADITDFAHNHDTEYYTQTQLDPAAVLGSNVLDARYYTETEVDDLVNANTTVMKEQEFIITNADNGDGTFSYTWLGNARTGDLTAGVYTFTLEETVSYDINESELEVYVNNDKRYSAISSELTEASATTFALEYVFVATDSVVAKIYQSLDTVSVTVGVDSITRNELAQAVEDDIDAGKNHSLVTTGNPHSVTQTEVGLGNVDNTSDLNKPISTATQSALDNKVGSTEYTTTILTTDTWTDQTGYFTLAKTVSGLVATDEPYLDLDLSSATVANIADIQTAWGSVYRAVTAIDTITFYALEAPTFPEDTTVTIEVIK